MAEQDDNALVTIHLDEPRQYRDRETMAVSVIGPGAVNVPRSTALRWNIPDAKNAPLAEPWAGYGGVDEVVARLPGLSPSERQRVRAYETERGTRQGVLKALDALQATSAPGATGAGIPTAGAPQPRTAASDAGSAIVGKTSGGATAQT